MIISPLDILSISDWRPACSSADRLGRWRRIFFTCKCLIVLIMVSSSISAYGRGVKFDGNFTIEVSSSAVFSRKWYLRRSFLVKSKRSLLNCAMSEFGVGQNDIPLQKSPISPCVSSYLLMFRTLVGPKILCDPAEVVGGSTVGLSSFLNCWFVCWFHLLQIWGDTRSGSVFPPHFWPLFK